MPNVFFFLSVFFCFAWCHPYIRCHNVLKELTKNCPNHHFFCTYCSNFIWHISFDSLRVLVCFTLYFTLNVVISIIQLPNRTLHIYLMFSLSSHFLFLMFGSLFFGSTQLIWIVCGQQIASTAACASKQKTKQKKKLWKCRCEIIFMLQLICIAACVFAYVNENLARIINE